MRGMNYGGPHKGRTGKKTDGNPTLLDRSAIKEDKLLQDFWGSGR